MKREILFRGKRVDNGEWIEGFYFYNGIDHGIITNDKYIGDWINILSKTVGQFTGLTDKNGKKIFEGDIVKNYEIHDIVTMSRFPRFWLKNENFGYEGEDLTEPDNFEIIGNIHDNPKLL